MTPSRFLPIVNLVGCLLITGIIVAQWLKERGLDETISRLNQQLASTGDELGSEKARSAALENDVSQLKESIESTLKARQETEEALAKTIAERDAQAAASVAAANLWEKAITERDEKIRELGASLAATRERLEEAITKLKAAAAR